MLKRVCDFEMEAFAEMNACLWPTRLCKRNACISAIPFIKLRKSKILCVTRYEKRMYV